MLKRIGSVLACLTLLGLLCACSASSSNAPSSTESQPNAQESVNRYTVSHVADAPDWSTIPVLDISNQPWGEPVGIAAHAQVCYSDDALYVHMWAQEANIRAEYTADDVQGNPYEDSCLEFFLAPVSEDDRYLNIEMNPLCCTCMEIGTERNNRVRLLPSKDALKATSARTDDGWEIEYRVPFSFIRALYPNFSIESGTVMGANFYKCGNLTVQKHFLTWNPSTSEKPDFHRPQDFGELVFE